MRVRLPPSVISTIESHLRPDFRPVLSLSTILDPTIATSTMAARTADVPQRSRHPTSIQQTSPTYNTLGRSTVAGPSQSRKLRPTTDPLPLSVPHLLRHHPAESHLTTANSYLLSDPFDPTSPSSVLRRQVTYSRFISTFLTHPSGLSSIRSLLSRSLSERVPISTPTLTTILKSVLDSSSDIHERVQVIHCILPLLPDQLDVPLLDLLLRNVIRDTGAEPQVVEEMISDCLKLSGVESKEGWPWQIWDLVLLAHAKKGDFRTAVSLLADFKQVVQNHLDPSDSLSDMSTTGPILSEAERRAVCQSYNTVLNIWLDPDTSSATRLPGGRVASLVPRQLAKDLIGLLGGEKPTVRFLNSWMRAERMAENWEAARKVWELIEGQSSPEGSTLQSEQADVQDKIGQRQDKVRGKTDLVPCDRERGSNEEGPDSESWTNLFLLYLGPISNDRLPPLRTTLRKFLTQSAQSNPNRSVTYPLLSLKVIKSIFQAIFGQSSQRVGTVDLPAALVLMRLVRSTGINLDRRTIDTISAGLMISTRSMSVSEQKNLGVGVDGRQTRRRRRSRKTSEFGLEGKGWTSLGLGLNEWDTISETLCKIRLEERDDSDKHRKVDMVHLPLSIPVGRTNDRPTEFTDHDHPSSGPKQEISVMKFSPSPRLLSNHHSFPNSPNTLIELLSPLTTLIERTIVALYRSATAPAKGSSKVEDQDDGEILRLIMSKVNEEILPPSRRDRRRAKKSANRSTL
ncbi:hypothetical protein IAR55_003140 [Kwoniella newhampshirensis]|uniref:Uncharacterized protein n=1 Tax=Kwoniella newhampshirensis TaxID=1651941 RepID=A0AAW0YPI9_9TREE